MMRGFAVTEWHLLIGLALTFLIWALASVFVIVNRLVYERREGLLRDLAPALSDPAVADLPPAERTRFLEPILARRSRRVVYRMVARSDLPSWMTEAFAEYSVEKWGLDRIRRDASNASSSKWRRVSALFALAQMRVEGIHDLARRALFDGDPDLASAAIVVLHRLGDREAAVILIEGLQAQAYSAARIATHLEQFPVPILDLLLPLLEDNRPQVRYWATSLLYRYAGSEGVDRAVQRLAQSDNGPIRKAVLETLGAAASAVTAATATHLLDDAVPYVRSAAVRALVRHATADGSDEVRREAAALIVPALADRAWEVRLAAKENLVALGPAVWREVSASLDSTDAFARNGAAEVLQNMRLLDSVMETFAEGSPPDAEMVEVLTRAFQEGGHTMVDAAIARMTPGSELDIENLFNRLRIDVWKDTRD